MAADADFALAVHGGAGTPSPTAMRTEQAHRYHAGVRNALAAGTAILAAGGSALDAVTGAVIVLEDDPLFNAGRGAVFTAAGTHEMDAAVMDGRDRRAGAVAGICGPKNPVLAARAVMESSPHVFLAGAGAMEFCRAQGLEFAPPAYFDTAARRQALEEMRRGADDPDEARRHGTVGAVARDRAGNLAAATSTGGITGKAPGRVGDSPVIGAGTYADNAACAVSATGHGEFFLRFAAAHELAARIVHARQPLARAAAELIAAIAAAGGRGGLVAIDHNGAIALPFSSLGMYRGYATADRILHTAIFHETYRTT